MNSGDITNDTMDFRTFLGKCPTATKTETKTETETTWEEDVAYCEGFRRGLEAARKEDKSKNDLAREDAYYEGLQEGRAAEHIELMNDWEFEPTLGGLAKGFPPMSKWVGDDFIYRYMTDEEEKSLYFEGRVIKFPVRWDRGEVTYDERHIFQKDWDKGERWTLGRVWKFAKAIYSKNKQKAVKEMGDHQFWEGIGADGKVYCGS